MFRICFLAGLLCFSSNAIAGVAYHNNGQFTFVAGSAPQTWNPLDSNVGFSGSVGARSTFSSPAFSLNGEDGTGSTGYDLILSTNGGGKLQIVSTSSALTDTVTFDNSTEAFSVAPTLGGSPTVYSGSTGNVLVYDTFNGVSEPVGYSYTGGITNYFAWAVKNTSSNTTYAVGWASFKLDPEPAGSDTTQKVIVTDWAYSLASSVAIGDTDDGSNVVPEPTGLAVLSLTALGFMGRRRRIRK